MDGPIAVSNELLCDPCQRLLSGENPPLDRDDGQSNFIHHTTAESFRQALALPCGICRRLRREFILEAGHESESTFEVAPTVYHLRPSYAAKEDTVKEFLDLDFRCSDTEIRLPLEPIAITKQPPYYLPALLGVAVADKSLATNNTGSDDCIDFVLSQLRRCRDTHSKCESMRLSKQGTNGFWPTRLIAVGNSGDSTIRLVGADEYAVDSQYVALSHCWGKSQPLQLTRSTAARLKAGFTLMDLPKTFQDAIHVTRKMRIQYIWIDSLCIVQDDARDWQREAACMQDVYSRAICCIAATAAKDADIGLFFDRDSQAQLPLRVFTSKARILGRKANEPLLAYVIGSPIVTSAMAIDHAPLNQRAWVAQERYLSTGTVHFTQEILFWECRESLTSEQDPGGSFIERATLWLGASKVHTLKSNLCDHKSRLAIATGSPTSVERLKLLSRIHKYWCRFRTLYSGLSLTKEEDILVALYGIAHAVAEVTNDTLVAGLWRGRLIEDLCWRRKTDEWTHPIDAPPRPSTWRAPTWSWASINRIIGGHTMWWEIECWLEFIDEMAVIEDLAVDQKPSGQLVNASLTLTCRLIPISPPDSGVWAWTPYGVTVTLDDCTITNAKDLGNEVNLVVLRHFAYREGGGIQGILVIPSRAKTGSYERVGYFASDSDCSRIGSDEIKQLLQSVLGEHHNAQETTIELV